MTHERTGVALRARELPRIAAVAGALLVLAASAARATVVRSFESGLPRGPAVEPVAPGAAAMPDPASRTRLLIFTSETCSWCRKLRVETLTDPDVLALLKTFAVEEIDVDRDAVRAARYQIRGVPTMLVVAPDGRVTSTVSGFVTPAQLRKALTGGGDATAAKEAARDLRAMRREIASGEVANDRWPEILAALGDPDKQAALHEAILDMKPFPREALVGMLTHRRLAVRLGALDILEEVAGDTFAFDPWSTDEEARAGALNRWREWSGSHTQAVEAVYVALTPAQITGYVQDLISGNIDRAQRARRLLVSAGAAIDTELKKLIEEHPEWPEGAHARVREVRYAVRLPFESRASREATAHRLVFGALDEKLKALHDLAAVGVAIVPILTEFLDDELPIVRETAVEALLTAGGQRVLPTIAGLLKHEPDAEVVYTALRSLGSVPSAKSNEILTNYIHDANEDLAIVALDSLKRGNGSAESVAIGGCLSDKRWRVRVAALEAVTKLDLKDQRKAVETCLVDKDEFVRYAAIKAIAAIAKKDKSVLEILARTFIAEDSLKGPVTAALVSMNLPVPAGFAKYLEDKPPDVLLPVIEALDDADDDSWQLAAEFMEHPDDDVACAAIRLVSRKGLKSPEYRAKVLAFVRGDAPRKKRLAAIGALELRNAASGGDFMPIEPFSEGAALLRAEVNVTARETASPLNELFDAFLGAPSASTSNGTGAATVGTTNAPPAVAAAPAPPANPLGDLFDAFGVGGTNAHTASAAAPHTATAAAPSGTWGDVIAALTPLMEQQDDREMRTTAAMALLPVAPDRAVPVLADGLATRPIAEKQRISHIVYMRDIPASRVRELLAPLLADPSEAVREEAVDACLAAPKDPTGLALMLAELDRPNTPFKPEEACAYQLRDRAKNKGKEVAGKWARRALAKPPSDDHATLALYLLVSAWDEGDAKTIAPYLSASNAWHRVAAWTALGINDRDTFVERYRDVLADPVVEVRSVVPTVLALDKNFTYRFDEKREIRAGYWYSSSSSRSSRRLPDKVREALQAAAHDASPLVRMNAGFALLENFESIDLAELVDTLEQIPARELVRRRVVSYIQSNYERLGPGFRILLPYIAGEDTGERWVKEVYKHFEVTPGAVPTGPEWLPRKDGKRVAVASTFLATAPAPRVDTNAPMKVVYFTSPGCSQCAEVESWWPHMHVAFPRLRIEVHNIKKVGAMRLNEALCERFGVSEKVRLVTPAVFAGGGFLIKNDVTEPRLGELLARSEGVPLSEWYDAREETLAAADRGIAQRYSSFGIGVVAAGGALDGINPCAFATIIFFLSYLQITRRKVGEMIRISLAFILGVFVAYLALGLGFVEILNRFDVLRRMGVWLNRAMAGFALVICVLSLRDGVLCLKGRAQEMTLQLPMFLKTGIHGVIRKGARHARFVLAAFVVGVIISVLELACTGQVYAPTILFMLKTDGGRAGALGYLLVYNLAFIAPLVVVFVLGVLGLRQATLTRIFQRHAAAVKFGTAMLFLVLFLFFVYGTRLLAWFGAA